MLRTRRIGRHDCRWLSAEARDAKRRCRRLERLFRRTCSTIDRSAFNDVAGDSASTWSAVRDVLHCNSRPVYSDIQCQLLAVGFSQFFADKLRRICELIAVSHASTVGLVYYARRHVGPKLTQLPPMSASEVLKILKWSRLKPSAIDILPTALLRSSADTLLPIFAYTSPTCRLPSAGSLQLLR